MHPMMEGAAPVASLSCGITGVQDGLTELASGGTLHKGQSLKSPSGAAKLVFQDDGNLVVRQPCACSAPGLLTASMLLLQWCSSCRKRWLCRGATGLLPAASAEH
jgi:hypothetical protein